VTTMILSRVARLARWGGVALLIGGWDLLIRWHPPLAQAGSAGRWGWWVVAAAAIAAWHHLRTCHLEREVAVLGFLHGLQRRMLRAGSRAKGGRALLTQVIPALGADAGCLRMLEPDGALTLVAAVDCDPRFTHSRKRLAAESGPFAHALDEEEPLYLRLSPTNDLAEITPKRPAAAALLIPLFDGRRAVGLLHLGYRRRRLLRPSRLVLARALVQSAGTWLALLDTVDELTEAAQFDPLSGLATRRHFEEVFRRECARARRTGRPLAIAMFDLDGFKTINDTYGHRTADRALALFGEVLADLREYDVAARYGGDEFVILMPETNAIEARAVVERVRRRLRAINEHSLLPFPLEVSVGIAASTEPSPALLEVADQAMYADKQARRHPPDTRAVSPRAAEDRARRAG